MGRLDFDPHDLTHTVQEQQSDNLMQVDTNPRNTKQKHI